MRQFPSVGCPEAEALLLDPGSEKTFLACKLNLSERQKNSDVYQMHRDLLRLRREDPVFGKPRRRGLDGAVLANGSKRLGLLGMRERVEMVGGTFCVDSAPGKATTIRVEIPQRRASAAKRPAKKSRRTALNCA